MGLSRDFLAMLTARPSWEAYTGDDQWGNNVYAAPVVIEAFVGTLTATGGAQDGQNQQDTETIYSVDLITDYRAIGVKDRLTLQTGRVVLVASTEVVHDAEGAPLFQNVTATSTPRG
jgi:hypothetical protein